MTRHVLRDDDGQILAVWCGEPLDEQGQEAMRDVVEAARRYHAQQDPDGVGTARQEAAMNRLRARNRRLRGEADD